MQLDDSVQLLGAKLVLITPIPGLGTNAMPYSCVHSVDVAFAILKVYLGV
jgi:hypothetical protein